jgi:hypothetical protein
VGGAGRDPRPGREGRPDQAVVEPPELLLADDRAQVHVRAQRITDPQRPEPFGNCLGEGRCGGAHDDVPARCDAGLPLVPQRGPDGTARGPVDVRVVEHDERVVAAELGDHRRLRLGREPGEPSAHLERAGEVDQVEPGLADQRLAGPGPVARDDVEDAGRQAGRPRRLGQHLAARDRRQLGRLEHDRVPVGQAGGQRPHGQAHRVVPGHDEADDAERDGPGQRQLARLVGRQDVAGVLGQLGGRVQQLGDRLAQLLLGLLRGAAGFPDEQGDQLVVASLELAGEGPQDGAPGRGAGPGPARLGPPGGGHRPRDLLGRAVRVTADGDARGLVEHRDPVGGNRLEVAVDVGGGVVLAEHGRDRDHRRTSSSWFCGSADQAPCVRWNALSQFSRRLNPGLESCQGWCRRGRPGWAPAGRVRPARPWPRGLPR